MKTLTWYEYAIEIIKGNVIKKEVIKEGQFSGYTVVTLKNGQKVEVMDNLHTEDILKVCKDLVKK
jgi:hypothetical protein